MGADVLPSGASRAADPVEAGLRAFASARGVRLPEAGASPEADWLAPLWEALRRSGLGHPGLAFAAWAETTMLGGLVPPILANSPDVEAMLESLRYFHPLVGRNELVVRPRSGGGPDTVRLSLRACDGGAADPDTVDACFALLCRTVRLLSEGSAGPDRVLLRRPEPVDAGAYREALGPAVAFGQPQDTCVFGPATLRARVRQADPAVLAMLAPYARRQLAQEHTPWSTAVRTALSNAPVALSGPPRLADVARAMAVSGRTLQARLQEEGASFSDLADGLQRERALALLAEPEPTGLAMTAIAARVGFATPAALTRAVRRWTGMTPTAYRRSATADPHPGAW
ncbi:helix-turn-helix domain-containing protein [Streptomyces sp. NPDC051976]|uniref:helix-turn-helix domain-containing protein n=1 Tax=Streptomyces sp. NPDC051976 TaxID=3154947 RepID=UPI0034249B57